MTCNSSVCCSLWLCRAAKLAYKIEKSSEFPDFKITEYFVLETSRNICNIAPSVKLWGLPAVDRMLAPFAKIRIGNQIRNTMSATFFQWWRFCEFILFVAQSKRVISSDESVKRHFWSNLAKNCTRWRHDEFRAKREPSSSLIGLLSACLSPNCCTLAVLYCVNFVTPLKHPS